MVQDEKTSPASLAEVAKRAAHAAGRIALDGFRGELEVRSKGGKDIVTQYDTQAESAAIEVVTTAYPGHAILGEESGHSEQDAGKAPYLWAIDPIDGTHNYAMQLPFWCSSVAVIDNASGKIVAACVFDALHNETFTASRGGGATLNGKPLQVSDCYTLHDAKLAFDIGYEPEIAHRMLTVATVLQPTVSRLRLLGSAVLAMTYVAAGRFDGYYHLRLQPWDVSAAALLVEEAGGTVTNWDGQPLSGGRTSAVAANPRLQPVLLSALQQAEK